MAVSVDNDADEVRAKAVEKPAGPTKFEQLRARYEWLDHLVRAGARYTERHGDHYAAAVTYFSVLALFPLILVSVAALGFVLFLQPDLLDQLKAAISANAPAGLDALIVPIVDNAIASRGTIGIIGLLGALYTGIGWMSNLREALSEQWGQPATAPPIVKKTLFDLLTLAGLGVAMVGSFAITALVFGFTGAILEFVGLSEQGWAIFLLGLFGVLLGLAANWLIFLWVITRLPRQHATLRSAAKAAVLGAVGFEVLKAVMTIYLESVTESPTGQIIGPFVGLMVFAFFASRFILFVTAWAATSRENEQEVPVEVPGPAVIHSEVTVRSGSGGAAAAGLLGAGALAGLLGFGLLRGRRRA
ncbi:MAG: YihY/virulence factor BrkB family protein [Pseudonocardia sp.]|nr:YihY/virulence factor BrkB family protein [Pseudonocardia sp.]